MGSLAVSRNTDIFGIFAARGKLLNCLSNSEEKIFANEELKIILSALNIVPGRYDANKLRYGKVAICSDGDADGSHIGLLIMAAFHKLAPDFIKEGRLFWLRTPLWIIKTKNKNYYYYNDKEMNEAYGKIKGERTRAKGIGALTAEQAKESMFSKEFQRLEPIEWNPEAVEILENLMGEDIQPRKDFVFSKIDFTEVQE